MTKISVIVIHVIIILLSSVSCIRQGNIHILLLMNYNYNYNIAQVPPSQNEVSQLIICPYKWEPMKELYNHYGNGLSPKYKGIG